MKRSAWEEAYQHIYLSFLVFQVYEFFPLAAMQSPTFHWQAQVTLQSHCSSLYFLICKQKMIIRSLPVNFKLYQETSTSVWSVLSSAELVTFSAATRRCNLMNVAISHRRAWNRPQRSSSPPPLPWLTKSRTISDCPGPQPSSPCRQE